MLYKRQYSFPTQAFGALPGFLGEVGFSGQAVALAVAFEHLLCRGFEFIGMMGGELGDFLAKAGDEGGERSESGALSPERTSQDPPRGTSG